jgi:hypothetical protein
MRFVSDRLSEPALTLNAIYAVIAAMIAGAIAAALCRPI